MNEPSDEIASKWPCEFRTTHWSLVTAASADSREALEELCTAYWPPLFSHLRRLGYHSAEAEDLTQAFFARLLNKRLLDFADHSRGRFRTFLLTALRRFVVNEWKQARTAKRGGGIHHLPLSADRVEQVVAADIANDLTPDRAFERHWALVVLQRAFHELEGEHQHAGKEAMFEALAPCLTGDSSSPGYDELADRLHATPAALRMSVSRLRKRLGELIRAEIRKTVSSDADVEDEITNLFRALRAQSGGAP
jgi:RNA polymerase sigma-70 factor (ECF subfamily)